MEKTREETSSGNPLGRILGLAVIPSVFLVETFVRLARGSMIGKWRIILPAMLGILLGISGVAFRASNATSYLSTAPETCINCHIMTPYYASWSHSRHRMTATCSDCHVPHDNIIKGLLFKGMDGMRHAAVFTLGLEPQILKLNAAAIPVIQKNCIRCHEHQIMNTSMGSSASERLCWECHRETPHGLVQSLSSSPNVRRPTLPTAGMPIETSPPAGTPGVK
jgi:cytochrome c nitrite reductase small subunit